MATESVLNNCKMKTLIVGIHPYSPRVKWMAAPYVLKAYFEQYSTKSSQIQIDIIDASTADSIESIFQEIIRLRPQIVGFSCYVWNISMVCELAKEIKNVAPETKIIFGGLQISNINSKEYVKNLGVDYCIINEGEEAFTELLEELLARKSSGDKRIRQGGRVDLGKTPSIYLTETVSEKKYRGQLIFLETQRGCSYRCAYCSCHRNLKGITFVSLERIKQEIRYLLIQKDITSIRITDANFPSDLKRSKEILQCFIDLKQQGFELKKLMLEYDHHDVDEEFIALVSQLKKVPLINNYGRNDLPEDVPIADGFFIVDKYTVISGVGIQSFNNESLKSVNRAPNSEKLHRFLEHAKQYNIILKLDMILGLPHETKESYLSGMNTLLGYMENTDHYFQLAFLQILPGTVLEERSEALGLHFNKESKYVYRSDAMNEDDMLYCAKLTILIHRIINSPLRQKFFAALSTETSEMKYIELIIRIYHKLCEDFQEFRELSTVDHVEGYHIEIFSRIPQKCIEALEGLNRVK